MEPTMQEPMMQEQADAGRATDTVLAHLSLGEVVIPRVMLDDPQVMQALQRIFAQYETDMAEFTVGDKANKINPETGHPEFFFKSLKKAFKIAAPLALSYFAPGIGTALGSALGAGASFAPIIGGAALGAGTSALTGGNVLQGAALGGVGGAVNSAASGNFNDTMLGRGISGAATSVGDAARSVGLGDILGSSGGTPLSEATGIQGMQGPTQGTGIKGAISSIGNSIPGASASQGAVTGAGVGAAPSAYGGNFVANLFGGLATAGAQDSASKQLMEQQRAALGLFEPYQNPQFTTEDFKADPGYQFRLQQGQQALERSQAARGGLFSGQAMRESQELGQGLADQTYNDAFNRNFQERNQGIGVAGQQAGLLQGIGNIQAANTMGLNNTFANTLSQALGGTSVGQNNAGRTIIGYDTTGKPIYG